EAGQYWVKVSVKDSHGNQVTKLIGVKVVEKEVKDEAPVITSKDSITLNVGDKFAITDLELMVTDKEDGNITDKAIVDTSDVNTKEAGQYWVKVSVKDSHGNQATKLIGVKVVEKEVKDEAPVITSKDSITITEGDKLAITDLDLVVTDKEDGNITDKAVIDKSGVDTNKAGTYEIKITVKDSKGNEATKTVKVIVKEKDQAPVITSKDSITLTEGDKLAITDLDLVVTDKEDGNITDKAVIDKSGVDTNKAGTYEIKITVKDSKGNEATKTVKVIVKEKTPAKNEIPVITSKDSITLNVGDKFAITDLDLVVMDKEDGNITDKAIVNSDVDTSEPGQYWVTISVSDSNGAQATKLIGVKVVATAPVITASDVTIKQGETLSSAAFNASAVDCQGNALKVKINVTSIDTNKVGEQKLDITATDKWGNTTTKTVTVTVKKKVATDM
ncbi:MAG: DUF5011 domain-containing protein, partial [Intestinibacter bartlettii]|uniref:immunoglobulin-like domain-containing protein n=1 Tax=Intestinibacter bartlettii TaxID=261299 RepID=UPI0026F0353E